MSEPELTDELRSMINELESRTKQATSCPNCEHLRTAIREIIEDINEGCGTVHAIKRLRALTEGE